MTTASVNHQDVMSAFVRLRKSVSFVTLKPRQFIDADLDQLAEEGIFPENDFLLSFHEQTERAILPLFAGDKTAFDDIMKMNVEIFSETFGRLIEQNHLHVLGIDNINFFVYCFCMIMRNGQGMNPYLGWNESDDRALVTVFRHLSEDVPVTTIGTAAETSSTYLDLSPLEISQLLQCRGILKPDGSLNRNALKNSILEFSWIYYSDFCNSISDNVQKFDQLSAEERLAIGWKCLSTYLTVLLFKYLKLTHASQDWFVENAFPILEEFLSRCESVEKQDQHALRMKFAELIGDMGKMTKQPVEEVLFQLACGMCEPKGFQKMVGVKSMLELMYFGAMTCDFAADAYPIETL